MGREICLPSSECGSGLNEPSLWLTKSKGGLEMQNVARWILQRERARFDLREAQEKLKTCDKGTPTYHYWRDAFWKAANKVSNLDAKIRKALDNQ